MTYRTRIALAVVALLVVILLGALLSLTGGAMFVMASDPCASASAGPICSPAVQTTVFFLPVAGWVVAVALSSVGVARLVRTGAGVWRPMAIGVAVFAVTLLIGLWIATRPVT